MRRFARSTRSFGIKLALARWAWPRSSSASTLLVASALESALETVGAVAASGAPPVLHGAHDLEAVERTGTLAPRRGLAPSRERLARVGTRAGLLAWIAIAALAALIAAASIPGGGSRWTTGSCSRAHRGQWAGKRCAFRIATPEHGIALWVHPQPVEIEYFRPLVMLSLWIERRLWGLDARGFHAVNLLLHAGAATALFALLGRLGLRGLPRLGATLGWALATTAIVPMVWDRRPHREPVRAVRVRGRVGVPALARGRGRARTSVRLLRAGRVLQGDGLRRAAAGVGRWGARTAGWARRRFRPIRLSTLALLALPATAAVVFRTFVLQLPLPPPAYRVPLESSGDVLRIAASVPLQILCWLLSVPVSRLGPLDHLLALPAATLAAVLALQAAPPPSGIRRSRRHFFTRFQCQQDQPGLLGAANSVGRSFSSRGEAQPQRVSPSSS